MINMNVWFCSGLEGSMVINSNREINNKQGCTPIFQNCRKDIHFPVQPNNKYYRYIRITSISKSWYNDDYFAILRVEFFGFVKSE